LAPPEKPTGHEDEVTKNIRKPNRDVASELDKLSARIKRLEVRANLHAGRLYQIDNIVEHLKRIVLGLWDWATNYAGYLKVEPPKPVNRPAYTTPDRASLELLRQQHQTTLHMADELVTMMKDVHNFDPDEVFGRLSGMASQIDTHFTVEDQMLSAADPADDTVQQVIRAHVGETKGLRQLFHQYHKRWFSSARIQMDRKRFAMETLEVFDMVFHRIEREDRIIYPHLEETEDD
jgi:hypothetical protein